MDNIWVYVLCFNESHFVGNFLTAYKDVQKIIVYDNYSSDESVNLLKEDERVEIRYFDTQGTIRDDKYLEIKNNCWKEARGKTRWVIVIDFDEVFCRFPELDLELPEDYTIIKPYGYNMISKYAPLYTKDHPYRWSKKGTYHEPAEKMCCFRPDRIEEINYEVGCHSANPKGDVRILYDKRFRLLHFKAWNMDVYLCKAAICRKRMSEHNIKMRWGFQYMNTDQENRNQYLAGINLAKPITEL